MLKLLAVFVPRCVTKGSVLIVLVLFVRYKRLHANIPKGICEEPQPNPERKNMPCMITAFRASKK